MNYHVLEMELQNDAYDGKSPEEAAEMLNAKSVAVLQERWVSARTLYSELAAAETILGKIEAAAESSKLLRDVNSWLNDPGGQYPGIDIGDAGVQAMVASLTGVLTADEIEAIQSLGFVLVSRAEQLGIGVVKPGHVTKARAINA